VIVPWVEPGRDSQFAPLRVLWAWNSPGGFWNFSWQREAASANARARIQSPVLFPRRGPGFRRVLFGETTDLWAGSSRRRGNATTKVAVSLTGPVRFRGTGSPGPVQFPGGEARLDASHVNRKGSSSADRIGVRNPAFPRRFKAEMTNLSSQRGPGFRLGFFGWEGPGAPRRHLEVTASGLPKESRSRAF